MSELVAYGTEVSSVFQLIGNLENDITKSIAWALARCPEFLKAVINEVMSLEINTQNVRIKYQEFEKNKGITDLEITDDTSFYIIIEAKRGWILPGAEQLALYSQRRNIIESPVSYKAIISMSECSEDYVNAYLPFKVINDIPVNHLSWKRIYELANYAKVGSSISQKNLLKELMRYLGGIMTMQAKESNWVYVVSLSTAKPENCDLTWIELVEKKMKYFHPFGINGWPKEPPNYIGFRYGGRLQSIYHIESYSIVKNLHDEIEEMPNVEDKYEHFVYSLGKPIIPSKVVKTGNIYASGRKWAMLDTLLTADTIHEASEISKQRMNNE
ncbi:hypothetical protein EII25_00585 [Erysipelotrichaceae bacterium OH741_COT-311]|nr:hypothetical protein EII25_00585 [Erysipelotrichaceae bacterium OH741_COT-311]